MKRKRISDITEDQIASYLNERRSNTLTNNKEKNQMKLTRHLVMGMLAFTLAYAPRTIAQDHNMHNMDHMQMNTAKTTDTTAAAKALDTTATAKVEYRCPMDKDVVSDKPGKCPKCGMALKKVTNPPASGQTMEHSAKEKQGAAPSNTKSGGSTDVQQHNHDNM